jgi:DNA-binding transcriptional ArsR family regulator
MGTDLAALGALIGDRTRAGILDHLQRGGATSASDLAAATGASASLTSSHLRKLLDGHLVAVEPVGRQRLYRLASVEVAELLEVMQLVAPETPVTSLRGASTKRRLRRARLCYDHLAGVLGMAVTDALVRRQALRRDSDALVLGRRARSVLAELDVDLAVLQEAPRPVVRSCTDWTERRPHASGGIGAAVAGVLLEREWVVRRHGSRGLDVTADGAAGIEEWLGVRVLELEAWAASA